MPLYMGSLKTMKIGLEVIDNTWQIGVDVLKEGYRKI
jgi:hypothetical protein